MCRSFEKNHQRSAFCVMRAYLTLKLCDCESAVSKSEERKKSATILYLQNEEPNEHSKFSTLSVGAFCTQRYDTAKKFTLPYQICSSSPLLVSDQTRVRVGTPNVFVRVVDKYDLFTRRDALLYLYYSTALFARTEYATMGRRSSRV